MRRAPPWCLVLLLPLPPLAQGSWERHDNQNNVASQAHPKADNGNVMYIGNFDTTDECLDAAMTSAKGPFHSITHHTPALGNGWAGQCFGKPKDDWKPINQAKINAAHWVGEWPPQVTPPPPRGGPTPAPGEGGSGGCGGGCAFLIIFFCGGFTYVAAGTAYNYKKKELRGREALPHAAFWADLPHLVKDGVRFSAGKVTGRGGYTSV